MSDKDKGEKYSPEGYEEEFEIRTKEEPIYDIEEYDPSKSKMLNLFELSDVLKKIKKIAGIAFKNNNFEKARKGYSIIVEKEPYYFIGHVCLGFTLIKLKKNREALAEFNTAISVLRSKNMNPEVKRRLMGYLEKQIQEIFEEIKKDTQN